MVVALEVGLPVAPDDGVAVLRLDDGHFGYADLAGGKVDGTERIVPEMTIRAGKIVFDLNARAAVPWRTGNLKYAPR